MNKTEEFDYKEFEKDALSKLADSEKPSAQTTDKTYKSSNPSGRVT